MPALLDGRLDAMNVFFVQLTRKVQGSPFAMHRVRDSLYVHGRSPEKLLSADNLQVINGNPKFYINRSYTGTHGLNVQNTETKKAPPLTNSAKQPAKNRKGHEN